MEVLCVNDFIMSEKISIRFTLVILTQRLDSIGRTLIPRYFRSIFEGGVTELYYNLKHPKESFHNTSITLDCDQCTMVTHHGRPMFTKLCVILEPMQELMSRHKAYALSPRDCLKTTLFQKWQRMVAPPESQRPANKRRKRKGSQSGGAANSAPPAPNKKRSPGPNFSLASQVSTNFRSAIPVR
ncbi:unnamed protein product [Nesidiocoris tenuis]|uniref:LIM interaction domain-containing protein n=1 Tax=Nesidiocoris tenuis TaxID=355587 RepID=A0A6H5GEQ4_9HEMI|nr:unnamed protein product [Nesidiocoris tenuis]